MTDRTPDRSGPGLNQLIQKKKAQKRLKQLGIVRSDLSAQKKDEPPSSGERTPQTESEHTPAVNGETAVAEDSANGNASGKKTEAPVPIEAHPAVSWEKRKMDGVPKSRPASEERRKVLPTVAPAKEPETAIVLPSSVGTEPSENAATEEPMPEFTDRVQEHSFISRSRTQRILETDMPAASLHLGTRKKWLLGAAAAALVAVVGAAFAFAGQEDSPKAPPKPVLETTKESKQDLPEWTEQPDETVGESSGSRTGGINRSAEHPPSKYSGEKSPESDTSSTNQISGTKTGSGTTSPDSGVNTNEPGSGDSGTANPGDAGNTGGTGGDSGGTTGGETGGTGDGTGGNTTGTGGDTGTGSDTGSGSDSGSSGTGGTSDPPTTP